MAFLILLKRTEVNQNSLRGLKALHEILNRKKTEFDLWAVVEALQLPPAASKELVM